MDFISLLHLEVSMHVNEMGATDDHSFKITWLRLELGLCYGV